MTKLNLDHALEPEVKVVEYDVIHFPHEGKEVILIYARGENGRLYENSGGRWLALPIVPESMRDFSPVPVPEPIITPKRR